MFDCRCLSGRPARRRRLTPRIPAEWSWASAASRSMLRSPRGSRGNSGGWALTYRRRPGTRGPRIPRRGDLRDERFVDDRPYQLHGRDRSGLGHGVGCRRLGAEPDSVRAGDGRAGGGVPGWWDDSSVPSGRTNLGRLVAAAAVHLPRIVPRDQADDQVLAIIDQSRKNWTSASPEALVRQFHDKEKRPSSHPALRGVERTGCCAGDAAGVGQGDKGIEGDARGGGCRGGRRAAGEPGYGCNGNGIDVPFRRDLRFPAPRRDRRGGQACPRFKPSEIGVFENDARRRSIG